MYIFIFNNHTLLNFITDIFYIPKGSLTYVKPARLQSIFNKKNILIIRRIINQIHKMTKRTLLLPLFIIILSLFAFKHFEQTAKPRILIFSKTAGYRHESISAGKTALIKLGKENGFIVDTTENENFFNEDSLKKYSAVVFLNTTGNVLNSPQQTSFERYIQAGGGYAGIHAAADTEYDWAWYGKLAGGYFLSHPKIQDASLDVLDRSHSSTKHLSEKWLRKDEWYNYKELNPEVKVLINLDEKSYEGGANGNPHPIAWYHEFDGGRAFYTGMGHTNESYTDAAYLKHLLGGIKYAMGNNTALNYSKAKTLKVPEENRFVKTVLTTGTLFEPTEMAILPNLDILLVQRRGEIMLYKESTKSITQVGALNAYFQTSVAGANAEEGVLGVAADPDYKNNNYVYIFYSPKDTSVNRLSRFKFVNDKLDNSSEKVVLQFYSQREICCHTGGSIAFGPDGLLYVSTGDNSTPFDVPKQQFVNKGYGPMDNRPGLEQYDAGRSSGNTNDLRGKIMRIRVKPDGSYEIPSGNLFPPKTPHTKPEIYVMGNRNPYRISIDSKTGFLYWGEVGPDANADSPERGSRGYDEVNQARNAGFFGWPYFVGNNYPYRAYDYKTGISAEAFDPKKPVNNSPNNTGLKDLPQVQPAFIWYPYAASKEFPQVGTGGRTAMAGPVYHSELYPKETRYPDHYNNKLFIYEWIRNWIKVVSMKPNGDYDNMEAFMPSSSFAAPVDMELGPDGRIYILEYGKGWFSKNPDAGIARIDYMAGNRPPKINELIINNTTGILPFKLQAKVNAEDYDRDELTYIWDLGNGIKKTTKSPSIEYIYTKAGEYQVSVKVTDKQMASSSSSPVQVVAGNARPKVTIQIQGNRSFYFPGKAVDYQVLVADQGAAVNKSTVFVSTNYTKGSDFAGASLGHQEVTAAQSGQALMLKSDCQSCHQTNTKSIGPAFTQVSAKYQKDASALSYLSAKIIKGGGGVWGEVAMPAHSTMSEDDAKKITQWVLSLENKAVNKASLPMQGRITPSSGIIESDNTVFSLYAAYTDQGAPGLKPLSSAASVYLRSNLFNAREITDRNGINLKDSTSTGFLVYPQNKGRMTFKQIDLNGIGSLELSNLKYSLSAKYTLELRLDSEKGPIVAAGNVSVDPGHETVSIPVKATSDGKLHTLYLLISADPKNGTPRPLLRTLKFVPAKIQ